MNFFLANILLATLWAAIQEFRPLDFIGGFILGYLMIWAARMWLGKEATWYVRKVPTLILFVFYYFGELVTSTLGVARALFRDQSTLKPGIIAFELEAKTDLEIVLLNNLLSLTPGTLGVDLSPDRRILYVHVIDVPDPDATCETIRTGLEHRLLEALR